MHPPSLSPPIMDVLNRCPLMWNQLALSPDRMMRAKRRGNINLGNVANALKSTGKEYCENCSPPGFSYWVKPASTVDKFFWVMVVFLCFACSSLFVKTAIDDWRENPTQTTVTALGIPIATLDHPAVTICKPNGIFDVGEYLRAVFDNFQFSCKSGNGTESCRGDMLLRDHYSTYSSLVDELEAGDEQVWKKNLPVTIILV